MYHRPSYDRRFSKERSIFTPDRVFNKSYELLDHHNPSSYRSRSITRELSVPVQDNFQYRPSHSLASVSTRRSLNSVERDQRVYSY